MTMAVAAETRISHSVARVSAVSAVAPRSLSRQVRDRYQRKKVVGRLCLPSLQRTGLMEILQAVDGSTLHHVSRIRHLLGSCSRSPVACQASHGCCRKTRMSSPGLHRFQWRVEEHLVSWIREKQEQAHRCEVPPLPGPSRHSRVGILLHFHQRQLGRHHNEGAGT